jgi:hypothetical protein
LALLFILLTDVGFILAMSSSDSSIVKPNDETIDALLDVVRHLADAENARTLAFDSKSTWLGGFSGTILALTTAVGRDAFALSLKPWLHDALVALYISSAVLLTAAAVAALSVLLPKSFFTIAISEIERYPFQPFVTMDKVMVQGRVMRGLIASLKQERRVNSKKAFRTQAALVSLVAGLLCVLGQALIIAAHAA